MDIRYKVDLVQKMQDYIIFHMRDEDFRIDDLYEYIGYSKRHADRCFKSLLGKTPNEYMRLLKMSDSAKQLIDGENTVLDAALRADFNSHEGYTKAFREVFGKLPSEYRKGKCFIPLFIAYPIKDYYKHIMKEENKMDNNSCLCMITPVKMPKRKLIFMRSKTATEYWSFCEECCCEWEGLFNSIPSKFDTAAILTLPSFLLKDGYGNIAAGIEVPLDYDGEIPENCEVAELEPCEMMSFKSQPFKTDDEFLVLMREVSNAIETFDYAAYGYKRADELAPQFNFGGQDGTGAKKSVPVEKIG